MGRMLEFLKEMLDEATAPLPEVMPRRAFGSWGYYVHGRIFALAYAREDRLGVKLPDTSAYAAARGLPGASEWAPHGSPMSDWVLLPAELHDDREAVQAWVVRAFQLVRAAPAEDARKPAAPKKRTASAAAKPAPAKAPRKTPTKQASTGTPVKKPVARKSGARPARSR
jgi:hypothetical protein